MYNFNRLQIASTAMANSCIACSDVAKGGGSDLPDQALRLKETVRLCVYLGRRAADLDEAWNQAKCCWCVSRSIHFSESTYCTAALSSASVAATFM